jgi:hypothetical protein
VAKNFLGVRDASERTLADGRVIVPGESFTLNAEDLKDPHNKRLIDEGQIVEDTTSGKEVKT